MLIIRVSSKEQNIDRQLEALKEIDVNIYIDRQSGKALIDQSIKLLKEVLDRKIYYLLNLWIDSVETSKKYLGNGNG